MMFANAEITPETIQRTREHFAALGRACIDDARCGAVPVGNLESFIAWQEGMISSYLAGDSDDTFTFMQRAHWLQTGECLPLLATPEASHE